MFTDSHFHLLEMENKGIDCRKFLEDFPGVFAWGMDIGIMPSDLEIRLNKYVYPANLKKTSGLFPGAVESCLLPDQKKLLQKQAGNREINAVGEAGLDWHWDYGSRQAQIDLFCWQLELAELSRLPLVIHNREADKEMLEIFSGHKTSIPLILHCYSSGIEFAKKAMDQNCYFSFSGNITYKNAESIRDVCRFVPADRILLETDSPYLAPVPFRGKTNTPFFIEHVYRQAAELKAMDIVELENTVCDNFCRLFS